MTEDKGVAQPSMEIEQVLDGILEQEPSEYTFRGKKRKMGWLGNMTLRKLTHITLTEKDEHKRNMKVCAILRVNGLFAWFRRLAYAFRWRYYYYVIDLTDIEALSVVNAAKKKLPTDASTLITILSTAMRDTAMAMNREEASATQAGQVGGRHTA